MGESDAHPSFKRLRFPSHPPNATSKNLQSSVSKHAFGTSEYSPPDAASSDVCLKTIRTAYALARGQQHLGFAQNSENSTCREEELLPSPTASWVSRRRTKSVLLSGQNLRQRPRSSARSLHLDRSISQEQLVPQLPRCAASIRPDQWLSKKQPHSSPALVNKDAKAYTERASSHESGTTGEAKKSQYLPLTKSNLTQHTHLLSVRFAEDPQSHLNGALEEWAFVMSKPTSAGKVGNVTTGDDRFEEHINLRNIYSVQNVPREIPTPDKPTNYSELLTLLSGSPGAPQFDEAKFENFLHVLHGSMNDRDVARAYYPVMLWADFDSKESLYFDYKEDKGWTNYCMLCPGLIPHLSRPKPDHALGIQKRNFPENARKHMGVYASPAYDEGPWIVVVREDKVENVTNGLCENMYSAAHLVNNILALKRTLGKEHSFYDHASVFSIISAKISCRICVHWVHRANDEDMFLSRELVSWDWNSPLLEKFHAMQRALHNVLHYVQHVVGRDIEQDMAALAANLNTPGWKPAWKPPPLPQKVAPGEQDSVAPEKVTTASSSRT